MTVREMKNDAVRLYITTIMPSQEEDAAERRAKAKELAHSFLGSFAASRTDEDWKKVKEDYLTEKYAEEK